MASSIEFVEYVCESISGAGEITTKRMFGEYGIYCNGIYFGCICDNNFYVKITKSGSSFLPEQEQGFPYEGAKSCFLISDLEDKDKIIELIEITCKELSKKH